jgi:AbiV family abortive infection protein
MAGTNASATVTDVMLAHGVWYAIEQCGLLLCDALKLYEQVQFPTAISLALLANEEFGKSRNLLDLWDDMEKGNSVTAAQVEDAVRAKQQVHQVKQAAALVGISAGVARNTEIGSLLYDLAQKLIAIRKTLIANNQPAEDLRPQLLADPDAKKLARAMKKAREQVLYVDFDPVRGTWLRPRDAFGTEVKELAWLVITQVRNIYVNFPENLLRGKHSPKLAAELSSWTARPALLSVEEPSPWW